MWTHMQFIKTFSLLWQNFPGIVCLHGNLIELSILTENKFSSHWEEYVFLSWHKHFNNFDLESVLNYKKCSHSFLLLALSSKWTDVTFLPEWERDPQMLCMAAYSGYGHSLPLLLTTQCTTHIGASIFLKL